MSKYLSKYSLRGLPAGFHSWLGFIAPVTLQNVVYEKLWQLGNSFWLISLLAMGVILSVLQ